VETFVSIIKQGLISIIRIYRVLISPFFAPCCRFYPSCSQYAIECIQQFHLLKAMGLICRRLLCCHPLHPGGVDPVIKPKGSPYGH
jgi:putative membrane protein insertion efficiency factor